MNPQQFASIATQAPLNADVSQKLALAYGREIPAPVLALCIAEPCGAFLDGPFCRKMDVDEIRESKDFWQVDFPAIGLLPIFDCGDNDFIAYRFSDDKWVKFNIVDEIVFRESIDWKTLI